MAFGLGFIFGPALSGVLVKVSYTAPIWAAAALTLVATAMAWFWLPETVHRAQAGTGMPFRNLPEMLRRPGLGRVLAIDFVYWFAFAIFQTTFALFAARRFRIRRLPDRLLLRRASAFSARVVQGGFIRPMVRRLGDKPTFIVGLVCSAIGLVAATLTHSVAVFAAGAGAAGARHRVRPPDRSRASSAARLAATSRGACRARRARSKASGRTVGPVWGNASLQRFGEGTPYLSAAALLMLTLWLCAGYHVAESEAVRRSQVS